MSAGGGSSSWMRADPGWVSAEIVFIEADLREPAQLLATRHWPRR